MIKYMAVAVAVAVSGGVAVPVAVAVASLTKRFFLKKISQSMFGVIVDAVALVVAPSPPNENNS